MEKRFEKYYPEGFRNLFEDEIPEFIAWARENYIPGDDIPITWHPVVQEECLLMNKEKEERTGE